MICKICGGCPPDVGCVCPPDQAPPPKPEVSAVRWTIMHPDLGGPLEVVAASAYDGVVKELDHLKNNSIPLESFNVSIPSDEWHDTIKERDDLAAQLAEYKKLLAGEPAQLSCENPSLSVTVKLERGE